MLKTGVFALSGESYTTYEVEETGYYRIDFVKSQSLFNLNPDDVVYSLIRNKNTYIFGNSSVYDKYLKHLEVFDAAQYNESVRKEWSNGAYFTYIDGDCPKFGYHKKTIIKNGSIMEVDYVSQNCIISNTVTSDVYDVKTMPANFGSYTQLTISKDNVLDDADSLYYTADILRRRFDLKHIDAKDFVVATDLETARNRLEDFMTNSYPFRGFDTETTGLDICMAGEDHMVGVILASDRNTSTYFPFRHAGNFNLPINFLGDICDCLKAKEDRLVGHNQKFDRQVMLKEGFDIRCAYDTMQIDIVLNPVIGKGVHGLKELIYALNGNRFLELDDIFINPKDIDFSVLDVDVIKLYACADGTNVLDLLEDQLKRLPKHLYKLCELECALSSVKADQEYYGIRVDTKKFEHQYHNCNYILDNLIKAFRTLTHEDGNIDSNQVMANLLYNKMKCPVLLRTDTGQASTSQQAIKKLAAVKSKEQKEVPQDFTDLDGNVIIKGKDLASSAYPALVILTKYKEYFKLKTAFYARFERTMKTGRVFFWVNQNGASTGRQSSPMHQLPPALKDCVISDAENRDFWGPDFSQIELRMIAYLAGEQDLIDMATDPDNDIHRVIGSLISNKEMWAITPQERSVGKRRNFGVVYLISKFGLAGQMFGPGYTKENVEFCEQQLQAFYKRFKRIDRFIKTNAMLVQKKGYMETAWYHRRRLFSEIFDKNIEPQKRSSILRMANNVPVQGTAADYLKLAEVQMDKYIRMKGWNKIVDGFPMVRNMLSIHDEIIISAHQSIPYEEIIEMITLCMQTPVDGAPPFFVQPARMDTWGGHSDDACAMPIRYRDKVIEDYNKTHNSVFHQSYFDVIIPDDIKAEINKGAENIDALIDKYVGSCTLQFNHGNYKQDFTERNVKEALCRYIESGITTYRIDDYIENLDNFRQSQLQDYMSNLIATYGKDYKAVGEHVRHPSLTFELLDMYSKQIPKDMEHVDRITEAARLYLEDVNSGKVHYDEDTPVKKDVVISDKDKFSEQLEALVTFDKDGEVVFEDASEEFEDAYNYFYDEAPDDIIDITKNKPQYIWQLGDCITLDTKDLTEDEVNKCLAYLYKYNDSKGFFKTFLIYKNKLIPIQDGNGTPLLIEELDTDTVNDYIADMVERRIAC